MTNERFSAQLRQHLLLVANDRPADGQLAAVVEAVSGTAQRNRLALRLTWNFERIGPFSAVAVRYGLVVLALAAASLAAAALFAGGSPPTQAPVSPWPSLRPGESRFSSTIHGISIDYPSGWQIRPATEPWTGGALRFDSPAADVIFDPRFGNRLYIALASQPRPGAASSNARV